MSENEINLTELDAAYSPFPTFESWMEKTSVDTVHWNRYTASLDSQGGASPEVLSRARQIATRAAALDTGAIEDLYEVDRGFTYTVAFEISAWEASLAQKGEMVKSLFEAQLHAYDYVLDLATRSEPISEASVRALHEEICRAQTTYRVMTAVGPQDQPLPKGEYKILPNHVRTRKATNHSYAPVDATPSEMFRFVSELRSDKFLAAHPAIQAAYAHYCLVAIHPFPDGNGRVARALASAFTYRAICMPIVILVEHKAKYLDSLEAADRADYQSFVDFMLDRSLDTIRLVEESVRSASKSDPAKTLESIRRLYFTRGGFTHEQIDSAGFKLLELLNEEFTKALPNYKETRVNGSLSITAGQNKINSSPPNYRPTFNGGRMLQIHLSSAPPVQASALTYLSVLVPKDASTEDEIRIFSEQGTEIISARIGEIIPEVSGLLRIRVALVVAGVLADLLTELLTRAASVRQH
jgi:Fic family protein